MRFIVCTENYTTVSITKAQLAIANSVKRALEKRRQRSVSVLLLLALRHITLNRNN